jgi:hypothetical protein
MRAEASETGSRKWLTGEPAGLYKQVEYPEGMRLGKTYQFRDGKGSFHDFLFGRKRSQVQVFISFLVAVTKSQSGKPGIAGAFVSYQCGIYTTTVRCHYNTNIYPAGIAGDQQPSNGAYPKSQMSRNQACMGIFSALLGNAGAVSRDELKKQYEKLLIEGEIIELGFKLIRDTFIFTNKRLILIDKQGITGSKVEYQSVSYKSITRFSVETAGTFELDAELKIWVSSEQEPSIRKQFNKSVNVYDVHKVLATYVLS